MTMKFITTAGALKNALTTAGHATPPSPNMVAYSGTLIVAKAGKVSVTGADGETITISATLEATDVNDGQVLLPPKPLSAYLATLGISTPIIVMHQSGKDLEIHTSGDPYKFRPIAATFPFPPFPKTAPVSAQFSRLGAALTAVRSSVAKDNPSIQLISNDEGLLLHSTDNYRLSRAFLPEAGFGEFTGVLPLSVLERVVSSNITHVAVDSQSRTVRFSGAEITISARKLTTPFPAVDTILSAVPSDTVSLHTGEVLTALSKLKSVADQAPIVCKLEHDVFNLAVSNADLGSGNENVSMDTGVVAPFQFAAKLSYLQDAIYAHRGDLVNFSWTGAMEALFFHSVEPLPVTCVVMPVRA